MLFITTELFIPQNSGGSVATYNYFKKYHTCETVLISFFDRKRFSKNFLEKEFQKEFKIKKLILLPFDIRIRKKPLKMFRTALIILLRQYPYIAAKFYSRSMIKKTLDIITSNVIHVVFIDHLNLAFIAPLLRKAKPDIKLFNISHNNESEIIEDYAKTQKNILIKTALTIEKRLINKFQKGHYKSFDKIKCISSVDAEHLNSALATNRFKYSPMPFYTERSYRYKNIVDDTVGVCGSLSWPPNIQGIEWYLEHIHPILIKKRKSYRFIIAGSGGNPSLKEKWQAIDGVEYLGFVEDLRDLYDQCKIVVVPLLSGSGIRIKILDAFSFSVPVVSTLKAAQGLNMSNHKEAFFSDDPIVFLSYVNKLLNDSELRKSLSEKAYSFLTTNHGGI